VLEVVSLALDAGAPAVQLRNKGQDARGLFDLARALRALTRSAGALFFVNDRLDVALASDADGVHLGPDDLPVAAARRAAPSDFLVGYSADELDAALAAVRDGADYVGCGTVFPTSTKADAGEVIGVDGLKRVVAAVPVPVVGIGGVTPERAPAVQASGAAGAAVVGAVMGASDVRASVRALLRPWT